MTVKVDLSPEIEERLRYEAERSGVPESECIVRILDAHLPSVGRRAQAVALLQSWIDGKDADDQRETGDYLVRVLDEDRLSDRKLFPPELEGKTW
jgi:predicted DNA-binding protein